MESTKLHPSLQQHFNRETLIEVYFDQADLVKWKDACFKQLNNFTKKIIKCAARLQSLQLTHQPHQHDNVTTNTNQLEPHQEQQIQVFLQQVLLNQSSVDYFNLITDLEQLDQETTDIQTKFLKLQEDFESLLKPAQFLNAYPYILKELGRRKLFNDLIELQLTPLNNVIRQESMLRKQFLTDFSAHIPSHFMPQLEQRPQELTVCDEDLPHVEAHCPDYLHELEQFIFSHKLQRLKEQNKQLTAVCTEQLQLFQQHESQLVKDICRVNYNLIKSIKSQTKQQLKDQVAQLQQQLDEVTQKSQFTRQQQVEFLNQVHAAHKQTTSELQQTIDTMKTNLANNQTELDKSQQQLTELQQSKVNLLNELQYSKLQVQKVDSDLQQIKKSLTQRTIDLQCQLVAKDKLLEQTQVQLEQFEDKHKSQIQDLQDQLSDYQAKLGQKRQEVSKYKSINNGLEAQIQELNQKFKELQNQNEQQRTMCHKLAVENSTHIGSLKLMQKEFQSISVLLDAKDQQIQDLGNMQILKETVETQTELNTDVALMSVEEGNQAIFIPLNTGEYALFDLSTPEDAGCTLGSQFSTTKITKVSKPVQVKLNIDDQPSKLKQILNNFGVIVVGCVTAVTSDLCSAKISHLVALDEHEFQIYKT